MLTWKTTRRIACWDWFLSDKPCRIESSKNTSYLYSFEENGELNPLFLQYGLHDSYGFLGRKLALFFLTFFILCMTYLEQRPKNRPGGDGLSRGTVKSPEPHLSLYDFLRARFKLQQEDLGEVLGPIRCRYTLKGSLHGAQNNLCALCKGQIPFIQHDKVYLNGRHRVKYIGHFVT